MFEKGRALRDPVTVYLDGEAIPAERGEPLATALLASDKTILARSPKLHRPRGPSCFRGACDGCLARVDGAPNVMTCLVPTRGGERIDSQNVVGSRKADLLRVTDWFFAKGIDHHHLMAGVPGLGDVMQSFARKVAGLGRLPSEAEAARPARRIEVDAVIVGGGVAGIAAASAIAAAGRSALLVDDGIDLGGALAGAPDRLRSLLAACLLRGVEVHRRSVAAGFYEGELLIGTETGAIVARPRATVLATGAHDGVLAAAGNDLPGIFSARSFCRLIHAGLRPDGAVAIVGGGFWAEEFARVLSGVEVHRVAAGDIASVHGTAGVTAISLRVDGAKKPKKIDVAAVALALPGAPAFELPAQAGAEARWKPDFGYAIVTDADGRAADGVWAAGECRGVLFDPDALRAEGERVGRAVVRALAGGA